MPDTRPPTPDPRCLPDISVRMERADLRGLPHYDFPAGYAMRPMQPEEAPLWTDIQRDAERLFTVADNLFEKEFGSDVPAISTRCFLLVDETGRALGTTSSWYSEDYKGTGVTWGRLHWVAIRPSHQRRGLARPMLGYAMEKLAAWHRSAWLSTSTARLPALKLYLDFGFLPDLTENGEAWSKVQEHLRHPALAEVLG